MTLSELAALWKAQARALQVQTMALYLACRDPRVPWYARALALLVAAYAFSPIDLIPDFIPILGVLDDLLIVPLGVWLVIRLIPKEVMAESRRKAESLHDQGAPAFRWMGALVIALWVIAALIAGFFLYRFVTQSSFMGWR